MEKTVALINWLVIMIKILQQKGNKFQVSVHYSAHSSSDSFKAKPKRSPVFMPVCLQPVFN